MPAPITEIINTGTELMLGSILNSHQQWLCKELTQAGFLVSRQTAVTDSGPAITQIVGEALSRSDLIITTGGLGPTSDDRTRELIAQLLGRGLVQNAEARARIENFFAVRAKPAPKSTLVQALAPEGAVVLQNAHGTAPGLALQVLPPQSARPQGAWLIMLPGPPRELHPMFREQVLPLLRREFPDAPPFCCCVLRTTGLGESYLEEMVAPHLEPLVGRGLEIGYCARVGEVELRLVCSCAGGESLVAEAEQIASRILADWVYARGDENLESALVRELAARGETLALAESCTGGYVANKITNIPGASEIFLGGAVTYSNAAKEQFLGVQHFTLEGHGAVSRAVAEEMAAGIRGRTGATYAAAITGIAGPGGGTEDKPVGTVFIAIASPSKTVVHHRTNRYERETFKFVTAQQTLELLRKAVLAQKKEADA